MSSTQITNSERRALLRTYFFERNEPNAGWSHSLSGLLNTPGLRGLWPMGIVDSTPLIRDISHNDMDLTPTNGPVINLEVLAPIVVFTGASSHYLTTPDSADNSITGTETYLTSTLRGLTVGGWFEVDALGSLEGLISKWGAIAGTRSYRLYKNAADNIVFDVSVDGTATATETSTDTVAAGEKFFAVGRFDPSASLDVFLNTAEDNNVAAIPASVFNSAAALEFGRTAAGSYLTGNIGMCFLAAAALPDIYIQNIYWQTRPLYYKG